MKTGSQIFYACMLSCMHAKVCDLLTEFVRVSTTDVPHPALKKDLIPLAA